MVKGSAVVQGLKSLVHSQLPLTAKESQRLLTALTSSFRRHLDHVHPQTQDDPKTKPTTASVSRTNQHAIHSSASYAEKHLASVLTNPLFVGGGKVLDYDSAKVDLTQNPHKDPIDLLEEYQEKGAASVRIAELCLESFMRNIAGLPEEQKISRFQETQPGRRTLLWLLQSGLFNTPSSTDNVRFVDMIAHILTVEGREDNLWEWLQLDMRSNHETPLKNKIANTHLGHRIMMRNYRWRGRLFRAMVESKLRSSTSFDNPKNYVAPTQQLHDALDMYLRAYRIRQSALPGSHLQWIPLVPAAVIIDDSLAPRVGVVVGVDPCRFDDYIETCMPIAQGGSNIFGFRSFAQLKLVHPTRPSADAAFNLLHGIYHKNAASPALVQSFLRDINLTPATRRKWHYFMARTVFLLRRDERHDEAAWVTLKAKEHISELASFFEKDVRRLEIQDALPSDSVTDSTQAFRAVKEEPATAPSAAFS